MTGPAAGPGEAAAATARLTGRRVRAVRPWGAGLALVELAGGAQLVAKRGTGPGATAAEAAGLRWLADTAAVRVPAIHGSDEQWLVLERITEGGPTVRGAERLGRELAALHAAGAPHFGSPPPGGPSDAWIGRAPMRDEPGREWPAWYAEHRVLPYLRGAVDAGAVGPGEGGVVEEVCRRLPELAGPPLPPARLHGDLWNGNVLWGEDGGPWLIDPAAHGGHRETDLAMLELFGCPHLDRVLAAYDEAAPLPPGRPQRVALHQLFPLLVHATLFGAPYGRRALTAARTALRG
ncbi:fructosamine kinase family protein [Streptantibioticus silvisoli]|uniref:Fructosamine kinase family protein n=1 Tax=Streptantibioticus silvisoli TaxID=2705255 RepID=A0ABT6W0X7_9ACTN|nr:fructosamine kinase family protein [Streptantibioticus silvisoli]MDI5964403.1 fructosamine kinase family protein [Streptantibioticus silvisoli]